MHFTNTETTIYMKISSTGFSGGHVYNVYSCVVSNYQ